MKFLSIDLIESLSHSAGYIRTKCIDGDYSSFVKKVARYGCTIGFRSTYVGFSEYFPRSLIFLDCEDLYFECSSERLSRICDWAKDTNRVVDICCLEMQYQVKNIVCIRGYRFCKALLINEKRHLQFSV